MTTSFVYNWPGLDQPEVFLPFAERWAKSYLEFGQGFPHKLYVCSCGTSKIPDCLKRLKPEVIRYDGEGFDIGSAQFAAKHIKEDFMLTGTARHYFWKSNPIKRMAEVFEKYPDSLLAPMMSYELCPLGPFDNWPNASIRAAFYGLSPARFLRYPFPIVNRERGFIFESGELSIGRWFDACGLRTIMVTWDGAWDNKRAWGQVPNRFRHGDQSACLVYDKHTKLWEQQPPQVKALWAKRAWG